MTRLENVALICILLVPCAAEMFLDLSIAATPNFHQQILVGCLFSKCTRVDAIMLWLFQLRNDLPRTFYQDSCRRTILYLKIRGQVFGVVEFQVFDKGNLIMLVSQPSTHGKRGTHRPVHMRA